VVSQLVSLQCARRSADFEVDRLERVIVRHLRRTRGQPDHSALHGVNRKSWRPTVSATIVSIGRLRFE
jgi:hypothetical protein